MTKERFRELVNKLHPDKSGDGRTVPALRNVLETWRQQKKKRFKRCWCGVTISAWAKQCAIHARRVSTGLIGLFIACSPCLGANQDKPPYPKQTKVLKSPRAKGETVNIPMAVTVVPMQFGITWNYYLPLPRETVTFVIESKSRLDEPWQQIGIVDSPPFPITTTEPMRFYRVGSQRP